MKLVTRAQLGWPASAAPTQSTTRGVKVHYEGTPVSTRLLADHGACITEWKAIRASHLANTAENYSDVAYNYAACPHGYLLEGRGLRRRTGANGTAALNVAHYAIVGLVGSSGLTEPTDAMLGAIRDGIDLLRQNGAATEIKGHRDGYATACPGAPLYAWVQKGAPRPNSTPPIEEDDMPLTDDDVNRIALAVHGYRNKAADEKSIAETGKRIPDAYAYLTRTHDSTQALVDQVDALQPELTPADVQAIAATLAASPTIAEAIAELVADKLATRLAN
jgi:hypothetical protein